MATEEQVLTLTTEFNDQASAAIAGVRQAIAQLSGPAMREAQRRMNEDTREFEDGIRSLGREALGVGRNFGDLVKVFGSLPIGVGLMAYEAYRATRSMTEWSRSIVDMNNSAKMAGLSFGVFKGVSDQLDVMAGVARDRGPDLIAFNRAFTETMVVAGKGNALLSLAPPGFAADMARALNSMRGMTDETDRLNAIIDLGEATHRAALKDGMNEESATFYQQRVLDSFHAGFLMTVHGHLSKEQARQLEARNGIATAATKLSTEIVKENQLRHEIIDEWQKMLAGPETEMIKILESFELAILHAMQGLLGEKASPASDFGIETPKLSPEEQKGLERIQRANPAGANPVLTAPGRSLAEQLGIGSIGGAGPTGSATNAAKFYGFTDAADNTSFADDWRRSENVEDNRTKIFDQNTNQVHDLNTNLQRIINQTRGGRGGGGAGDLAGQLGLGSIGGGGGGGGGYRGTGPTGTDGTGPTTPPPPPVTGPTGTPLAAVTGGQPFGINVSPERFSEITGLPPSFMNVSAGQRAYARGISTGMGPGGVGLGGQFVGGKPPVSWPTTATPGSGGGFGATGTVTGTGASISGATSVANLEHNSQAQAAIARFAAENPNVTDAKTQLYSLVAGESGFGRDMSPGRKYSGYFQMGQDETFAATGQHISGSQLAAMSFDQQLDIYSKWVHHASPNATNLGLFNAASNPRFQTASDDTVVYHAGTRAAQQNAATWGKYSPGGPGGDITVGGIKKYYSRGDPDTNRQIAAAGTPAATTAVTLASTGGPQVTETLPSGAQVIRGAATTNPVTGVSSSNPLLTGINPTTGGSIDKAVLQQAAQIAQLGNTKATQGEAWQQVKSYITSQGLTYSTGEDCAEFVTAVLARSQHLPPGTLPAGVKGDYPSAASYLHYGDQVDAAHAQPGDVLSKWGGGHAMIVGPDGYNPATHTLDILSANNDRRVTVHVGADGKIIDSYYNNFRIGHLNVGPPKTPGADTPATAAQTAASPTGLPTDPFAWPSGAPEGTADSIKRMNAVASGGDVSADRAALDSRATAVAAQQNIKLKIRHRNAPPDVTAKADGDAFKGHTMDRTNAPPPEAPTKFKAGGLEFA
jgi:hypothetical protein